MKNWLVLAFLLLCFAAAYAQQSQISDSTRFNTIHEGAEFKFRFENFESTKPKYSLEGADGLNMQLDSLGNFQWKPSFDLVDRLEKQKEVNVIVQAEWADGKRTRKTLNFIVLHQNRAPLVEDLPVFYVKQASANRYQIPAEYVTDPDGDPLVFKSIQSQLPEGLTLSSLGLLTWTPSRNQFNTLRNNPLILEFVVQDQPEKAETRGKIKIAQTQLDLPPEILIMPGDSIFTIKEDELVNLKIYVTDPNGDDNISNVGFVSSDNRIPNKSFVQGTSAQSEFTWSPGYYFVEESQKVKDAEIIFFALDKSNNRVEKSVKVKVLDTENLEEKDKFLYIKYKNALSQAKTLLDLLDLNHEQLNKAYKQAKKGKKNRSILNASLGATTGLAPVAFADDPSTYKAVSAIGGTTVLTMGTLEATEVIGKSKADILEKLKINVEIRNQLQLEADNFARKYALKSSRRSKEFDPDRDKLLPIINNQKLVVLELDASKPGVKDYDNKELKKTFPDFSEQ
jgi:Putative Ig domain